MSALVLLIVVGVLMYACLPWPATSEAKLSRLGEIGRIMLLCGLLAWAFSAGRSMVHLP